MEKAQISPGYHTWAGTMPPRLTRALLLALVLATVVLLTIAAYNLVPRRPEEAPSPHPHSWEHHLTWPIYQAYLEKIKEQLSGHAKP